MTAVPRVRPPEINRTLRLPPHEHFAAPQRKTAIVLHHTVGGSMRSSFDWWCRDQKSDGAPLRVGTAYGVERDGTVYEFFDPKAWAIHLFRSLPPPQRALGAMLERQTIGVELASEGGLSEKDGNLWAFGGKKLMGDPETLLAAGRVVRFAQPWRGFSYFDAYDEAQVVSTCRLVAWLCHWHDIAPVVSEECGNPAGDLLRYEHFSGVLTHACVRADKSDTHPLFPYDRLRKALR